MNRDCFDSAPQKVEDNLVFTLESGAQQKVVLNAYSWDATIIDGLEIKSDTTISSEKPIVVRNGITVDSMATLTIKGGTTLYFHQNSALLVKGTLKCEGTSDKNVVLRGERLDNMFDYLPYDFAPGQWQGISFQSSSYGNELVYTDLHGAYNGIVCDSSDVNRSKLVIKQSTIHNSQGYGLIAYNSNIDIENCQFTNTLNDCVAIYGGDVEIKNSTLAQFYGFDSNRGAAIRFSCSYPLINLNVTNSLITGYADDVLIGEKLDSSSVFNYQFANCIIRTPKITTDDSLRFTNVVYEDVEDTIVSGKKNFKKIDIDSLRYDFHLDSVSVAIDTANTATSLPYDRDGMLRDDKPDIGCFEYKK